MAENQQAPSIQAPAKEESMTERFEKRYAEEKAQEKKIVEEREYQIFLLTKEYNLPAGTVNEWKKQHRLGIHLIRIGGKPYVFRAIGLGEFVAMAEKFGNQEDQLLLKKELVKSALLYPVIENQLMSLAGLPQTLTEAIFQASGFEPQIVVLPL